MENIKNDKKNIMTTEFYLRVNTCQEDTDQNIKLLREFCTNHEIAIVSFRIYKFGGIPRRKRGPDKQPRRTYGYTRRFRRMPASI